jgi:hypothetical protein
MGRQVAAPFIKIILATLALTPLLSAAQTTPADKPTPRTDKNSQLAHEQLLAKAKEGRIDVYFEGDSITRRWDANDYAQLQQNWKKTSSAGTPPTLAGAPIKYRTFSGASKTENSLEFIRK